MSASSHRSINAGDPRVISPNEGLAAGDTAEIFRVEDAPNVAAANSIFVAPGFAWLAGGVSVSEPLRLHYEIHRKGVVEHVQEISWRRHAQQHGVELDLITGPVVRCLQRRPRTRVTVQAESLLEELRSVLRQFPREGLPPLRGVELADEGFAIEWILSGDRRLVFSFETNEEDSGWHFVSSKASGGIRAYGEFSGLELQPLVAWALSQRR
jgi:hypothetical protein